MAEHLPQYERHAPAVQQQMVVAPDKEAPVRRAFHEREAHQGRNRKIEPVLPVQFEKFVQPPLMVVNGKMRPIQPVEDRRSTAVDHLHWFFQPLPGKHRSQRGVTGNDELPGLFKCVGMECSLQRPAQLLDVDAGARLVKAVKQKPLLKRRQRVDVFDIGCVIHDYP